MLEGQGRLAGSLLLLTLVATWASPAGAQDATKAAAEAIFEEGLRAFEAGDLATACPKLEAAVGLTKRESLGGLLLLAECQEKRGMTATAWALYREVASKAARAGQADREAKAREGEGRVAPQLHRVTLRVAPSQERLAGLVVRRGQDVVPPEALGIALPTDPGPIEVTAEAPGHAPLRITREIPAGAGETVLVLELAPAQASAAPVAPAQSAPRSTERSEGASGWLYGGLVTAGVGVACLGISTALILAAKGDYDEAVVACPSGRCPTEAEKAAVDDARALGDVATITFVAGAVLGAAGVTMVVVDLASGSGDAGAARLELSPVGLRARGSF